MKDQSVKVNEKESILIGLLFWCGLVVVASNYLTIPLLPVLSQYFDTPIRQIAWTGTIFSLCYAVGCLFMGPLSDRFGRKSVMSIGLVLLAVTTAFIPLGSSVEWLMFGRAMEGLAASSFTPVVVTYIVERFSPVNRASVMGFVSFGFLLAAIFGQLVSSYIVQYFIWQGVFYVFGSIYLLSAIAVLVFVPDVESKSRQINMPIIIKDYIELIRSKRLFQIYAIAIMLLLTLVTFYSVLGEYLSAEFFLDKKYIFIVRAIGIVGMLLALLAGKLAGRFSIQRTLRIALILAIVGLAMAGVSNNIYFLTGMSVVFVGGIALAVPTLINLVGEAGGEKRSLAVSLYTFILFLGAGIGPFAAVGLLTLNNYTYAFLIQALLLFIGLIISLTIKTD